MSMVTATYNQSKAVSNENNKPVQMSSKARLSNANQTHTVQIIQRARMNPGSLTHTDVMQLQSTIGNRAVIQLLSELQSSQSPGIEERPVQPKKADKDGKLIKTKEIMEKATHSGDNKTGIPDNLKAGLETLSNLNLSSVRVHPNSDKPKKLGAHAYTQGENIHIAPGQEKQLPHEGWHAVQQKQGRVRPTLQMKKGALVNDDAALEKEADIMGGRAAVIQKGAELSLKTGKGMPRLAGNPIIQTKSIDSRVIQLAKNNGTALDTALDILQTILDIVGFIPGIGDAADGVNAIISLMRGDIVGAAFSAIAIIPVIGSAVAFPLKIIYRAGKNLKTIRKAVSTLSKLFGKTSKIISSLDGVFKTVSRLMKKIPDGIASLGNKWLVQITIGKGKIAKLVAAIRKGVDSLLEKVDEIISRVKSAINNIFAVGVKNDLNKLQKLAEQAAANVKAQGNAVFTQKQIQAMNRNPNLKPAFEGTAIDKEFKRLIVSDSELASKYNITAQGKWGPDLINKETGEWVDITTNKQVQAHFNKYDPVFGQGMGFTVTY